MSQTSTFQVILSSDGKHTVIATTDQVQNSENALAWATETYDSLVKRYGLKHQQYANGNGNGNGNGESVPMCGVHHLPMTKVNGKNGEFWSCHQRNADGSYCSYKPSAK